MRLRLIRWERDDSRKPPGRTGEFLPEIWGGHYDRLVRRYVDPPDDAPPPKVLRCHAKQLELLEADDLYEAMLLGGPGTAKTYGGILWKLRRGLKRPNTVGGIVGPTVERLRMSIWPDYIALVGGILGWIDHVADKDMTIRLKNGRVEQFVGARIGDRRRGSASQGRSWDDVLFDEVQNCDPEAIKDGRERGRRAGKDFRVRHTATNFKVSPHFASLKASFVDAPNKKLIRVTPEDNTFVDRAFYEELRSTMTEREYRIRINAEDIPSDQLTYPEVHDRLSTRPLPTPGDGWQEITRSTFKDRFGIPANHILTLDPGSRATVTVELRCFLEPVLRERVWFICGEVNSLNSETQEEHSAKLLRRYETSLDAIIGDPHRNHAGGNSDPGRSAYQAYRADGWKIFPAVPQTQNLLKFDRIQMVRRLLCDARGVRRLFFACNDAREHLAPKTWTAFKTLEKGEDGQDEKVRKDWNDMTHWTAGTGYGLVPFELRRGAPTRIETLGGARSSDPLIAEMQQINNGHSRPLRR